MFSKGLSSSRGCSLAAAALAAAALAMFAAGNAQANMILNGDFSVNAPNYTSLPGYSASPNPAGPSGWTISEVHVGVNGPDTGFAGEPFAPTSTTGVSDFAFIQDQNANLSQAVATTAGQAYTLTYDAAARAGDSLGGGVDTLEVVLTDATNSNQITTQTPGITEAGFNLFTLNFTAPSASTGIEFENLTAPVSGASGTVDVSNVALAAVPEPATLGLVALGTLGLLLQQRRRVV